MITWYLFKGTKIKSCCICDRKREVGVDIPKHECYANWKGSSTSMESAILLEGFQTSMETHGLIYSKFVGDGDSSVFATVIDVYKGMKVQKVECMNHVLKNLTSKLLQIYMPNGSDGNRVPLSERKNLNSAIPRIRSGVKGAIIYNNENSLSWKGLRDDILNVPRHVFGEHSECKPYFCTGPKQDEVNRYVNATNMSCWRQISKAISRAADLSESLIHAKTSNAAESFMSIACKYMEGKRKHFGQRYLYKLRMAGAVFAYNECSFWATDAIRLIRGATPTEIWMKKSEASHKEKMRAVKFRVKRPLKLKKYAGSGDWDYGLNPKKPNMPEVVLLDSIKRKRNELHISPQDIQKVEERTRDQAESKDWQDERKCRVTASMSGKIYKLRVTTDNTSVLNDHFGRKRHPKKVQDAMEYGKKSEKIAIAAYQISEKHSIGYVQPSGFWIEPTTGLIGASPDGMVGSDGLVEIKCPYALYLARKPATEWETVSPASCSFNLNDSGSYEMKKTHDHYYQVVTQLYVTGRIWCDYFVWSEFGSVKIRVYRNHSTDELWRNMKNKFEEFWEESIAPELVDSRFERGYKDYYCSEARIAARKRKIKAKDDSAKVI